MMALGSSNGGAGSSGPSNLSASAPPFTVDKSVYRPKSDAFLGYSGLPYGFPLNPSPNIQLTVCEHNSDPVCADSKVVCTSSGQSAGFGGVLDCQHVELRNSHFSPLNQTTFEPNLYDQYQSGAVPTTFGTDSYYSHYVSSVEDSVFVENNEHKYDLLLDSVSLTTSMSGLPQPDYSQTRSPLECSHSWTGFWNGVDNGKQTIGSSLLSKDYELSGLSSSKSYNKLGVEEGLLYSASNPGKDCIFEVSNASLLPSTSTLQGSPLIGDSFQGLAWNPWATNPYSATADEPVTGGHFAFVTSSKSPHVVVKSPSSGKILMDQNDISKTFNLADNREDVRKEYDLFSLEPPSLSLDFKSQFPGNGARSHVRYNFPTASRSCESLSTKLDDKGVTDHTLIEKSAPLPSLKEHDFLELNRDLCSGEISSDSTDSHTAVVDSPCWKGAPSSRFSPFENPDALGPELLSRDLESSNKMDNQGFHAKAVNSNASVHIGHKANESSSCVTPLDIENVFPTQGDCSPQNQKHLSSEMKAATEFADYKNSGKEVHDKIERDGDSKASVINSNEIVNEREAASEGKLESSILGTLQKSQEHAVSTFTEAFSIYPSELVTSLVDKPLGWDSNCVFGTSELVNTMKNLSEMLSSGCSNDRAAITEQDCSSLRDMIININACLGPARVGNGTPSGKVMLRETPFHGGLPNVLSSASSDSTGPSKNSTADAGHGDSVNLPKDESIAVLHSGRDDVVEPISLSTKEAAGDVKMTQAIKRVLYENLPSEVEMDVQALFYKNLWLEAEAALCCSTVNTRFRHMKKEIERTAKVEETNEVSGHKVSSGELGSKTKDDDPKRSTATQSVKIDAFVMDRFQIPSSRGEKFGATKVDGQDSTIDPVDECGASKVQEITECLAASSGLMNSGGLKPSPVKGDQVSKDPHTNDLLEKDGDAEASVFTRFNILKMRNYQLDSGENVPQHSVFGQEHGQTNMRNILDDRIQVQLSQSGAHKRLPWSDNMQEVYVQEPTMVHAESHEAEGTKEPHLSRFIYNSRSINQEDVKTMNQGFLTPSTWGQDLVSQTRVHALLCPVNANSVGVRHNLGDGVLEGWYDCPASEWVNVSREDFQWQK